MPNQTDENEWPPTWEPKQTFLAEIEEPKHYFKIVEALEKKGIHKNRVSGALKRLVKSGEATKSEKNFYHATGADLGQQAQPQQAADIYAFLAALKAELVENLGYEDEDADRVCVDVAARIPNAPSSPVATKTPPPEDKPDPRSAEDIHAERLKRMADIFAAGLDALPANKDEAFDDVALYRALHAKGFDTNDTLVQEMIASFFGPNCRDTHREIMTCGASSGQPGFLTHAYRVPPTILTPSERPRITELPPSGWVPRSERGAAKPTPDEDPPED